MTDRRKLRFDRADSKARLKRLMFVLNNPEEAVDQGELDRACRYAEHTTDQMEDAIDTLDEVLDVIEDQNSEWRQKMDALKARSDQALGDLNRAIARCEEALVSRFKGRCSAIELNMPSTTRFGAPRLAALMFWHRKDVWGLYVIAPDGGIMRLTSASKTIRMAAMGALEDLLVGLQYEDEAA
jgi:ElaB/YqjD/DUF883 family membrane-anchored ribosome-binding protein